jgi:hypothetical protein
MNAVSLSPTIIPIFKTHITIWSNYSSAMWDSFSPLSNGLPNPSPHFLPLTACSAPASSPSAILAHLGASASLYGSNASSAGMQRYAEVGGNAEVDGLTVDPHRCRSCRPASIRLVMELRCRSRSFVRSFSRSRFQSPRWSRPGGRGGGGGEAAWPRAWSGPDSSEGPSATKSDASSLRLRLRAAAELVGRGGGASWPRWWSWWGRGGTRQAGEGRACTVLESSRAVPFVRHGRHANVNGQRYLKNAFYHFNTHFDFGSKWGDRWR